MAVITKFSNLNTNKLDAFNADIKSLDVKVMEGEVEVHNKLLLPNSPDNPETAVVTSSFRSRQTADGLHEVVDGSTASVEEISGATVKCSNLLVFPYDDMKGFTNDTLTVSILDDGGIKIKGKLSDDTSASKRIFLYSVDSKKLNFTAGTLTLNFYSNNGFTSSKLKVSIGSDSTGNYIYNEVKLGNSGSVKLRDGKTAGQMRYCMLDILGGETFDCTVYLMLTAGTTAKPYQPYFTGLKHANINSIVSTGKNQFDISKIHAGVGSATTHTDRDITVTDYFAATNALLKTVIPNLQIGKTYTFVCKSVESDVALTANRGSVYFYSPSTGSQYLVARGVLKGKITIDENLYNNGSLGFWGNPVAEGGGKVTWKDFQVLEGDWTSRQIPEWMPYVTSIYQLPRLVELGVFDKILPRENKIVRRMKQVVLTGDEASWSSHGNNINVNTGIKSKDANMNDRTDLLWEQRTYGTMCNVVNTSRDISNPNAYFNINTSLLLFSGPFLDSIGIGKITDSAGNLIYDLEAWKAWLKDRYNAGDPVVYEYYVADEFVTEEPLLCPSGYEAYNEGTEQVVSNMDNSPFGANITTITKYSIHENPQEAAKKAYVNNGLAKKLDKTGGTITGHLIVEGTTDTELGAIVSKQGDVSYGLAYDDEAFKLGLGTIDDETKQFTFSEGEGLPIALRNDSSTFTDGHYVKWSAEGNKFVDGGESTSGGIKLYKHTVVMNVPGFYDEEDETNQNEAFIFDATNENSNAYGSSNLFGLVPVGNTNVVFECYPLSVTYHPSTGIVVACLSYGEIIPVYIDEKEIIDTVMEL